MPLLRFPVRLNSCSNTTSVIYADDTWLLFIDNAWLFFVAMVITAAKVKQAHPIANVRATNLAGILRPFQQLWLHIVHLLTSNHCCKPEAFASKRDL